MTTNSPRWRELSYDVRLFIVFFASVMAMSLVGGLLPEHAPAAILTLLAAMLAALSIRHRRRIGWVWPGARGRAVIVMPNEQHYLFGLGIAMLARDDFATDTTVVLRVGKKRYFLGRTAG